MSESDQFRHYAEEAMRWVAQSKTEEEKQLLIELLCTWTAAAVAADAITIPIARPPEHAGRWAARPGISTLLQLHLHLSKVATRSERVVGPLTVIDQDQRRV